MKTGAWADMIHPSPVRGDGWLSGCSGGWGTVHRGHRALQRGDGSVCAESLHRCAAVPRPLAGEARREAPQPFGPVQRGGRKDCVPPQAGRESAAPLSALLPDCLQAPKGKCTFAGLPASAKREVPFCRIARKRQKGSALLSDCLQAPKGKCPFAGLPASAKREVRFCRITCKRQKGSALLSDYLQAPKGKCAFAGSPASAKRGVRFCRITCKRQKGSALLADYLQAAKGKRPFAGLPESAKMERMGEGNRFFLHVQPPMPQGHFPAADAAQAQAAERRGMPARFLRATHTSPQPYAPHTDPSA